MTGLPELVNGDQFGVRLASRDVKIGSESLRWARTADASRPESRNARTVCVSRQE